MGVAWPAMLVILFVVQEAKAEEPKEPKEPKPKKPKVEALLW